MRDFKLAIKEIIPIVSAYLFVGIACGVLYKELGFSLFDMVLSSMTIYGGSIQLMLAPLIAGGEPLYLLALMGLFIGGRQLFYAIAFLENYKDYHFLKRIFLALTLTDEIYSIEVKPGYGKNAHSKEKMNLMVHGLTYLLWIVASAMGYIGGDLIPFDLSGIEFSATAFFMAIVVDQFMAFNNKSSLLIGSLASIFYLLVLGPDAFILPSLITSLIILTLLKDKVRLEGKNE